MVWVCFTSGVTESEIKLAALMVFDNAMILTVGKNHKKLASDQWCACERRSRRNFTVTFEVCTV